jgi:hypothetical protein
MEQTMMGEQSLNELVTVFLTDLAHTNRSPHTRHAYRGREQLVAPLVSV